MDYKFLGKRLREERIKLKLTQEQLAEIIEISDSYIGQIERGERSLSLDTLIKLANSLGVTVDYLLQDSVNVDNNIYLDLFAQLLNGRSQNEKQMAIDVIKVMFAHLDEN